MLDEEPIYLARALAIEKNAEASGKTHSAKGLGRRLNWGDYIEEIYNTRRNGGEIAICGGEDPIPCGCYDEGEE